MTRWMRAEAQGILAWRVDGWSDVRAWCTGRQGGVSLPPFASLNLSRSVGDLPAAVEENRRRALHLAPGRSAIWAQLVHGRDTAWVDASSSPGPMADVLLTRDPSVVLAMSFADCVPVWIYAPDLPAVALVHAGWRGTALSAVEAAVAALEKEGAQPEHLLAAVGPAIGGCCYEVDDPVVSRLSTLPAADSAIRSDGNGRYHLDLARMNWAQLAAAGVPAARIARTALCTACHPAWFFSHRGERGRTGRLGGFISLWTS